MAQYTLGCVVQGGESAEADRGSAAAPAALLLRVLRLDTRTVEEVPGTGLTLFAPAPASLQALPQLWAGRIPAGLGDGAYSTPSAADAAAVNRLLSQSPKTGEIVRQQKQRRKRTGQAGITLGVDLSTPESRTKAGLRGSGSRTKVGPGGAGSRTKAGPLGSRQQLSAAGHRGGSSGAEAAALALRLARPTRAGVAAEAVAAAAASAAVGTVRTGHASPADVVQEGCRPPAVALAPAGRQLATVARTSRPPPAGAAQMGRHLPVATAAATAPAGVRRATAAQRGPKPVRRYLSKVKLAMLQGLPKGRQPKLPMEALFRVSILGAMQEASEQKVSLGGALGTRSNSGKY